MSSLGEGGEGRSPFHVTQFRRRVRRNWFSPKGRACPADGENMPEPVPALKRPHAFQGTGSVPNAFESRAADFKCPAKPEGYRGPPPPIARADAKRPNRGSRPPESGMYGRRPLPLSSADPTASAACRVCAVPNANESREADFICRVIASLCIFSGLPARRGCAAAAG